MDVSERELHYRWLDTPAELVVIDEVPDHQPHQHPQPSDSPPAAEHNPLKGRSRAEQRLTATAL
jgi:hypothetical protein